MDVFVLFDVNVFEIAEICQLMKRRKKQAWPARLMTCKSFLCQPVVSQINISLQLLNKSFKYFTVICVILWAPGWGDFDCLFFVDHKLTLSLVEPRLRGPDGGHMLLFIKWVNGFGSWNKRIKDILRLFIAVSWSDAFYNIRKKINLPIFTKPTIYTFLYGCKYFNKKELYQTKITHNNGFFKQFLSINCIF